MFQDKCKNLRSGTGKSENEFITHKKNNNTKTQIVIISQIYDGSIGPVLDGYMNISSSFDISISIGEPREREVMISLFLNSKFHLI